MLYEEGLREDTPLRSRFSTTGGESDERDGRGEGSAPRQLGHCQRERANSYQGLEGQIAYLGRELSWSNVGKDNSKNTENISRPGIKPSKCLPVSRDVSHWGPQQGFQPSAAPILETPLKPHAPQLATRCHPFLALLGCKSGAHPGLCQPLLDAFYSSHVRIAAEENLKCSGPLASRSRSLFVAVLRQIAQLSSHTFLVYLSGLLLREQWLLLYLVSEN